MSGYARIAVDIGGTFTDVVIDDGKQQYISKVLTNTIAPDDGVMDGIAVAMERAGLAPDAIALIIHGTTLATNALIERKGAKTALVTTDGFRDTIEIASEHRYAQYDISSTKARPLVPRPWRYVVPERMDVRGGVQLSLDTNAVRELCHEIGREGFESVAIGFMHSYANPAHERAVRDIFAEELPDLYVTLSSDVCPEIREYERFTTAIANAYVQPLMAGYLARLEKKLKEAGYACPILLMTSGGGLTTVEMASQYPIRLVESGPAGGAVLAAHVAREEGEDRVMSFDMGGTTAKICFIDHGRPMTGRMFEVDRQYKFMKGSGFPVRIPVIEMVEIGAGGGSIAHIDSMTRLMVGPHSAGSSPGPACYGRGGMRPTVTDANLVQGRIVPARFAGGSISLDDNAAINAVARDVGAPLALRSSEAAFAITEIVDENMANAARMHAAERGLDFRSRTMVAFGGSAPLHAARLAEKLTIRRVIIPVGAGVGSACGFLYAPVSFNAVKTFIWHPEKDSVSDLNTVLAAMYDEAESVVALGAESAERDIVVSAELRYVGQGHDVNVDLPGLEIAADSLKDLRQRFEGVYKSLFGLTLPHLEIELRSLSVIVIARGAAASAAETGKVESDVMPPVERHGLYDRESGEAKIVPVLSRSALINEKILRGPLVIAEAETTTVVPSNFTVRLLPSGALELQRVDG